MMGKIKCPQCGGEIIRIDNVEKIVVCKHCASTVFIENISTNPKNLIQLKQELKLKARIYIPISFEQYKYDEGIRTEWVLVNEQNKLFFLTQDDENYSLVGSYNGPIDSSLSWHSLLPNMQLSIAHKDWIVTEKRLFINNANQQLMYSYLTAQNAELMVLIFNGKSVHYRRGFWLDPFEISDEN